MVEIKKTSYVIVGDFGTPSYYRKAIGKKAKHYRQSNHRQVTIIDTVKICVLRETIIISADTHDEALQIKEKVKERLSESILDYTIKNEGFMKHILKLPNEEINELKDTYDWKNGDISDGTTINDWRLKIYNNENTLRIYGSLETKEQSVRFLERILNKKVTVK